MTSLSKTFVILSFVFSYFILSSFTKPIGTYRIQSDYYITSDTLFLYRDIFIYDSLGRVATDTSYWYDFDRIHPPKPGPATTYYTRYMHDSVFQGEINNLKFKYKLNAKGYAATDESGNIYTYDADGFYIRSDGGPGVATQTVVNGDIVSKNYLSNDSSKSATMAYTYYADVDPRDFGFDITGRRSMHLLKSRIGRGAQGETINIHYTYEYDDKHRIIKEIAKNSSRSFIHTYTYFD